MVYDVIVIGGGPAGVSAAVYAASRGLKVLLFEKNKIGGLIGNVSTVTHYAGVIEHETGHTFSERLMNQAVSAGVEIKYEDVTNVLLIGDEKQIKADNDDYIARSIILANGTTPRKLGIPGELEFAGKGTGLNAARDGEKYKGKNMYVVGGADGAIKEAIYLSQYANKLTIIHFENKLGAIREFTEKIAKLQNVEVWLEQRLTSIRGADNIQELEITSVKTGEKRIVSDDGCAIFIYAGAVPNTEFCPELNLKDGYIVVNDKQETGVDGVYAAGDICAKQVRQVSTAASDGTIAGINAALYLMNK